ncbi:MAG: signal peptide peptidase SppA [Peptococcaceae bacterium]|nr:signal peptide peptidase SppA [Peptococcaceae bacterium]
MSEYQKIDDAEQMMPAPKPPKKHSKWLIFFGVIGFLVLCAGISIYGLVGSTSDGAEPFASGQKNVAIIDIDGQIEAAGDTYNQEFINAQIKKARNDSDNVAILLLIDSPGGAVYESDETYLKLLSYKKKTGRPVYAYCESMAASGGYYIASAADEIVANRNSMVGSIGVIGGQFVDATGLLEKLGIDVTAVHSGANKLMGATYEKPTEEQIAILQSISDEAYEQFVGIVAKSRGMSTDDVKKLADGRVYSAKQAKANGLIDGISTLSSFDKKIKGEVGEDVVFYHESYENNSFGKWFSQLSSVAKNLSGNRSELSESLEALDKLTYTQPMYLYQ